MSVLVEGVKGWAPEEMNAPVPKNAPLLLVSLRRATDPEASVISVSESARDVRISMRGSAEA
jgi:hypothetical protein